MYQDYISQHELESDTVVSNLSATTLEDFCVGGISPRLSPDQRRKQQRTEQSDHQDILGNSQQAGGSGSGLQAGVSSQPLADPGRLAKVGGGGVGAAGRGRGGPRRTVTSDRSVSTQHLHCAGGRDQSVTPPAQHADTPVLLTPAVDQPGPGEGVNNILQNRADREVAGVVGDRVELAE